MKDKDLPLCHTPLKQKKPIQIKDKLLIGLSHSLLVTEAKPLSPPLKLWRATQHF